MPISVKSVINQSYQLIGMLDDDEVTDGTRNAIALMKLNQVIANLNASDSFPYAKKNLTYTVTASKNMLTIGEDISADINDIRPEFIKQIVYYTSASSPYAVRPMSLEDIMSMDRENQSTPSFFAYNPIYPLGELYFDVKLQGGATLTIIYNSEIPAYEINDTIAIPSSYNDVLITQLATVLAVNGQVPADTLQSVTALRNEATRRQTQLNKKQTQRTLWYPTSIQGNIYTGR